MILECETGYLFGTPTVEGCYDFTVRVDDSTGLLDTMAFSVEVGAPLSITSLTLPQAYDGVVYSAYVQTDGECGQDPAGFALTGGALPPRLSLGTSTGLISGTPTAQGTYGFTVTATGCNGCTTSQAYAGFTVDPPPAPPPCR